MILRFKRRALEELFDDGTSKRISRDYHQKILELLDVLNAANHPRDLAGVAKFHPLKGNRKGTYSMHVSGNWVLTFRFDGANITDVEFEDYH